MGPDSGSPAPPKQEKGRGEAGQGGAWRGARPFLPVKVVLLQAAAASWFVLRWRGERRGGILFPVGFPLRPALPRRKQRRLGVERRVGVGGGVQRLLGGGGKGSFCRSLASCSSSQPLTALDPGPRCLSSVQFSRLVVSNSLRPHESQHARRLCPSPTPGVHPNSCPSSQ